jgi:two-component system, NtrC family, sensor kinase
VRNGLRLAPTPLARTVLSNPDTVVGLPGPTSLKEVLRATSWSLRALLLLALLLPAGLAAWFAWHQRGAVLEEVERTASRSVIALEEHAGNVLDTHSLILAELAGITRGKSWEQIAEDARLQQMFADVTANFRQIAVIGIADADGRLRLSSASGHVDNVSIAERDYFLAHQRGEAKGIYFSEPFRGRMSGVRQFAISIPRVSPSGAFDGVIYTAVPLDYFTNFWKQFTPSGGHLVPLMRSDGTLMVRYPALKNPQRLKPDGPFMSHVRQAPRGLYTAVSQVDGIERINAYSQVKHYPLYISFSLEREVALQKWVDEVVPAALMATLAAAALLGLWLMVVRQSHQQRVSAARWREVGGHPENERAGREDNQETMRQGRKMEAIGQLAGGIAHDFNNLLAAIVGNLQLMRLRLDQGRVEDLGRYVRAAEAVAGKATAMTQRLLAFSRRQTLSPKPTDLNERVPFIRELIERAVGPAIRIHTAFADGPCITLCDPNQFENALLNLAINARDAMPGGGELTIATHRVALDSRQAAAIGLKSGDYVTVGMKDTGTGMPAEVIQRAFDPFFTTKPIGQGTGLGLSMVYGFVTQSGGQVKIESQTGAGTTVTIYLPVHEGGVPADEARAGPTAAPRPDARTHVMLVDDEESLREPLAEMLTELGYQVTEAMDGAQGLEVLKSSAAVDLLVTDVGLPGHLNGRQLADAGRQLRPHLKVMFITGYAEKATSGGTLLGTGMEIMIKPFGLHEFARKVAAIVGTAHNSDAPLREGSER